MARRIKKVEGGHGHHGGAWKVAYADFVTAMMALFMVLWLLASTDQKSRQEISNYFRTGMLPEVELPSDGQPQSTSVFSGGLIPPPPPPPRIGKPTAQDDKETTPGDKVGQGENTGDGDQQKGDRGDGVDERVKAAAELEGRLNRLAALDPELAEVMHNVRVEVAPEGILIEAVDGAQGLLFDVASARLNEPLERFLRVLGPAISTLDRPIEIQGHTDARPFVAGARISNWDLSYQRAAAAREILEASGVASTQVSGVFARGASEPYIPKDPYAPQNRRLSILVKIAKTGGSKLAATESAPQKQP
jgi:chemotaxis protein MotB